MNVLYGVQGTGNGHLSRSRVVIRELNARGVSVDVLMSGRPETELPSIAGAQRITHRDGLSFVVRKGRVNMLQTALGLSPLKLWRDVRNLALESYDLVITDFELVTAWAGKLAGRTVLGIGHQYAFGRNAPEAGADLFSRAVMRHFAPASVSVGLHWQPYSARILPPIVDTEYLLRGPAHGAVVVYLPWEERSHVTDVLRAVPGVKFRQYCKVDSARQVDNVTVCPISHDTFKRDLCGASAVVCNAGFELVSEALHLGLPVLVRPLAGQMEQLSNAFALEQAGLATAVDTITVEKLQAWLDTPQNAVRQSYPQVAAAVAEWIVRGDYGHPEALATALWDKMADLSDGLGHKPGVGAQSAAIGV